MKNKSISLLLNYIKPYKFRVALYVFLTMIRYIGLVINPILIGIAIEALTLGNLENFIIYLSLSYAARVLTYNVLEFVCMWTYNYLEKMFVKNVTQDMYKKIGNLPALAFEEKGTGEISNRLVQDPERVISLLSTIIRLGTSFVSFIFIFIIITTYSWIISIEVIIFMIIMLVVVYVIFPKFEKMEKINRENTDKLSKTLIENITGIREIKALGIKNILNLKVNKKVDNLTTSINKTNNFMNIYWNLNNLVYYIFEFLIFFTAAYLIFEGNLTISAFIALQSYMWRVDEVVYSFGDFGKNYSKVKVALNRIDEIINNRLYDDENYGNIILNETKGLLKLENVKFKYKDENKYTLKGMDLECLPNKKTAIIGRSGNGKSTIFNLLVRYFDSSEGKITIDDVDIKDLTEDSLRQNISIIRQNPHIFNMTIKENLRLVKPEATDEEIIKVCKKAYIHDYISSLTNGYETMIGEGGVNLSGGQKQRLAIARTLLINTKIILFDEATSALDNESQEYIKKTIDNLVKDHTIIIVAHRLSTIIDADIINVVHDGKIIEKGTHKQLMKKSKVYKNLYKSEI